jgi:hypothetical protein
MAEGPYYSQLPTVAVKPFGSRRHCFCQCLIVTHVCILAKDISIVFFKTQLPRSLYVPLSKSKLDSACGRPAARASLLLSKLWYTKLLPKIFRVEFKDLASPVRAATDRLGNLEFQNANELLLFL